MAETEVNIATCEDEELLTKLLGNTNDGEKRKLIRGRLKEIRDLESQKMAEKKKNQGPVLDAVALRAQQAEAAKARQMANFQEQAKVSAGMTQGDDYVKRRAERAEAERQAELNTYNELAKVAGVGSLQGGSEKVKQMEIEADARNKARLLKQFDDIAKHEETPTSLVANTDGHSYDNFEFKIDKSSGGLLKKPATPKKAMNAFKAMDKANNPDADKKPAPFLKASNAAPAKGVARNPSQIKQMLLDWCKFVTKDYKDKGVNITNFSSSWADGLAFCALIHKFHPESFNFDELSPKNRRHNFDLAFTTAQKCADITPLLEVDDMVKMKTPDWKCVFTYVQFFYRKFRVVSAPPEAVEESAEASAEDKE